MKNYYLLLLFLLMSCWGWGQIGREHVITDCETCGIIDYHAGDLNGDGANDIVVSSFEDEKLSAYLNNGEGSFNDPILIDSGSFNFINIVDFNQDRNLDVICFETVRNGQDNSKIHRPVLFLNDGNLNFERVELNETTESISSPLFTAFNFVHSDMDNDEDIDLIISYRSRDEYIIEQITNNGENRFTSDIVMREYVEDAQWHFQWYYLGLTDHDFDGDVDIIATNRAEVFLLENEGKGIGNE